MKEYIIKKHHRCKDLKARETEVFKTEDGIWYYVDFKEDKSLEQIDSLHEYSEIGNLVVGKMEHFAPIANFIETNQIDLNIIEKKGFNLIDLFAKMYEQLIPVVALKNGDCLDNVDKKQYGIMTANYDVLTDFYAKSYEWILENIIIIVGLNNIYVRNDLTQCSNGKTYANLLKESKGNRLKNGYIDEKEP